MQVGKPMGKFGDSWRVRKHVRLGKAMARATIAQVHMLQQQQACIPGAASAATSQAVQTLAHRGWRPTPQVGMGKVVFVLMGAFTSILLVALALSLAGLKASRAGPAACVSSHQSSGASALPGRCGCCFNVWAIENGAPTNAPPPRWEWESWWSSS